ncbi:MAG TPA: double-strand break repair helicase AddA [Rhizomicrobium sp.]|jgi:ATP-dependent helicase/nuclease subunit A
MSEVARDPADPRRSAWVAANAGAGKTYLLTNRVTRLLLSDVNPAKILCLTYTKAAAAEMQSRLFGRLGKWAMLPDDKLLAEIASIGGGPVDDLRKARRLFAQALETPGGLKIQTIHSFCQNLLSRFPLEAGITPAFRVLDDQTTRDLLAEARARVLECAGENETIRDAITQLVTRTSEGRMQQILDAALGTDRRKLDRFLATLGGQTVRDSVRAAHGIGDETTDSIAESFCAELRREMSQLREAVAWLATGSKQDQGRSADLAQALDHAAPLHMFPALREALLTERGRPFANFVTKKLGTSNPGLLAYIDSVVERFCAAEERHRCANAADLAQAALILAKAIRDSYAEAKRIRGVLDYDDLINASLQLLERSDAAAWVLYKLDGGIDHVLIDEAQDTSPEQWAIVRKLTEEFFAGEGRRDADKAARTVFAVGDEKQSIFSFQGADPAQFDRNRHHFGDQALGAELEFVNGELPQSRRSLPEILHFVDTLFDNDEARTGLTSGDIAVRHETHRQEKAGIVELWPSIPAPATPQPDPWAPVDVERPDSPVVQLAKLLAERIKGWIDSRMQLPGHDRPVRPADIMILLPRREPFASEIIRRLKERNVPVAGADRMQLTEQIAAMDLIALGRFALLPEDDLNLATLLRSPFARVDETALFQLSHNRKRSLWAELAQRRTERPEYAEAHAFLTEMLNLADFKPPFEFYAHALRGLGIKTRLMKRLGAEAADAIEEFLSLALTYEAANTPSLEGFLHWIERGGAEVKRDMERARDEVRVMTVHGAKGLEADIVILPDTTGLPDSPVVKGHLLYTDAGVMFPVVEADAPQVVQAAKAVTMDAVLREHRRLLYVALTRARDRLYICGFETKRKVRQGSWYSHAQRAADAIGTTVEHGKETLSRFGTDTATTAAAATSQPAAKAKTLPAWIRRAPPPERLRPRLIRPFDAAGLDEPATISPVRADGAQRFARGLLVHTLLARLPDIAAEQRRDRAIHFLTNQNMPPDEAAALSDSTLHILEHPDFAAAFTPQSRAEVAIVADLPELGDGVRVNGRIDRIAVTDSTVLIVDFKTNRPPPTQEEDVHQLYRTQMALYRAAAAKIFLNRRIACALVWTEGPHLMALSDVLLDAETLRIRARLDPQGERS